MPSNLNFNNYDTSDDIVIDDFESISFEKWTVLPDGSIGLPDRLEYLQDDSGGCVERYLYDKEFEERKVLALLKPSSHGDSTLRYRTPKIENFRGHYIRESVKVKSANETNDAIQVSLGDGIEAAILKSYENSGMWERLELIKKINEMAEDVTLTCNVKSTATAGAYLDWIKIDIMQHNDFFDYNNVISEETVFKEYNNFLFHNYVNSDKAIFEEFKKFSFEEWLILPDDSLCPEPFNYQQGRSDGSVEKYIYDDGVNEKKVCALIKPSTRGNSAITYQTDQIDDLKGRYIRISAMVKSDNKTFNAIQVDIQSITKKTLKDGTFVNRVTESPIIKAYNNSGKWERLELFKYVDENTDVLKLTCNVYSTATTGAYFDELKIDVIAKMESVPDNKNSNAFEFEGVLKSKRWSSFLLPKKYFELIHKEIPSTVLVEMFAVDKPVFQIKKGIIQVPEKEIPSFFRQLGTMESVKLLQDNVIIVDKKLDPALSTLKRPAEEYISRNQAVSFKGSNQSESIPDVKEDWKSTYTIENYSYDSCDLEVSTNDDGILYWADGYDKGWQAFVNKKEVPIYRANVNFKAIAIPKGTSYINFTFNPSLFKAGLFMFYGTIAVCILAMLIFTSFYSIRRRASR